VDIPARLSLPVRRSAGGVVPTENVSSEADGYRAPSLPAHLTNGDDQVYAAAELVRAGLASRVTIVNAAVDDALPESWEIRGTPVGLVRLSGRRSRVTAGPPLIAAPIARGRPRR
jgi:hypothetical protein